MQRAGGGNGVGCRRLHTSTLLRAQAYGNRRSTIGECAPTNGNESHSRKTTPAQGGRRRAGQGRQRPSSNTTSMLTDSVLSPGETEVSLAKPSAAIARTIGIGRGTLVPPSLMLTIRRTFRPSAPA